MKNLMSKEYEALHNISIPTDDDTVDWEASIEEWDSYYEKWHVKYITWPIGTAYRWLKEWPYRIKYYMQRGRRCWSDEDAWAIDYWLVRGLIPMLERLKEEGIGTPSSMYNCDEGYGVDSTVTNEADRLAEQRWANVLGEILYGLKCAKMLQDMDYDYNDKELAIRLSKSSRRSLKLIGEHLFNLWD